MSERNDETPREGAANPTQEAIDEGGASDEPVDVGWETEDSPHEGEEGQAGDVA
jgi:hypothetical protein